MKIFNESNSNQPCLRIGVLNIMPSADRVATENMFIRRFKGFALPVEIVWLSPKANDADFEHTENQYLVPNADIYRGLDYLFRTGANVEFIKLEENEFLDCLRKSLCFDKGSTSLCWSAGQIYADQTGQAFSDLLIGQNENGKPIKRSGYFDYLIKSELEYFSLNRAYMACSRHFHVDAEKQSFLARQNGFAPFAISSDGQDVAGFINGKDLLLFTHNEYDPERLPYETERCIERADTEEDKAALRAKFPELKSYGQVADVAGQKLFQAILSQIAERKYAPVSRIASHPVQAIG